MAEQLENVKHDYIRYANCWEDADILIEGLDVKAGERVLSIGSAGDNSFSLLTQDPDIVVAVDINEVQLNLIELKKAAIKTLDYPSFLSFLGFTPAADRAALFTKVKAELTPELITFWTGRMNEITEGVIYQGKFEKYFHVFKNKVLPLIHSKKNIEKLFLDKNAIEQKIFFKKTWNNWRWRLLFKLFFSQFVMGKYGRDPEFMKEVKVKVSDFIYQKASGHLSSTNCQKNYFLQFIMNGQFGQDLPHYARAENYQKIKSNIDKIVVFKGFAEDAFNEYDKFHKFNLSNIFEYMPKETFKSVVDNIEMNSYPNARYCYWNLMVPRSMDSVHASISNEKMLTQNLSARDKGFFYTGVKLNYKTCP